MALTKEVMAWRQAGKHLPDVLRDFHDQKDLFKLMHWMIGEPDPKDMVKRPSWVEGQCYTIDCFLWFMARHGYTLQKSRAKLTFDSLEENLKALDAHGVAQLQAIFKKQEVGGDGGE